MISLVFVVLENVEMGSRKVYKVLSVFIDIPFFYKDTFLNIKFKLKISIYIILIKLNSINNKKTIKNTYITPYFYF